MNKRRQGALLMTPLILVIIAFAIYVSYLFVTTAPNLAVGVITGLVLIAMFLIGTKRLTEN